MQSSVRRCGAASPGQPLPSAVWPLPWPSWRWGRGRGGQGRDELVCRVSGSGMRLLPRGRAAGSIPSARVHCCQAVGGAGQQGDSRPRSKKVPTGQVSGQPRDPLASHHQHLLAGVWPGAGSLCLWRRGHEACRALSWLWVPFHPPPAWRGLTETRTRVRSFPPSHRGGRTAAASGQVSVRMQLWGRPWKGPVCEPSAPCAPGGWGPGCAGLPCSPSPLVSRRRAATVPGPWASGSGPRSSVTGACPAPLGTSGGGFN